MSACRETSGAEALAGTAPVALAWLIVEHPGSWGPRAVEALPDELTCHQDTGIRVLVARHPDRPLRAGALERYAWLAYVAGSAPQLARRTFRDARELVGLDWAAIAHGDLSSFAGAPCDSTVFVCTNGSRDACCALVGRPVLVDVLKSIADPLRAWECSHVGGHRFSPVALSLPMGVVAGRVGASDAIALMDGDISWVNYRGRSALEPRFQAAEAALLRAGHGFASHYELRGTTGVRAVLEQGKHMDIDVIQVDIPDRPESCGADPLPARVWQANLV